MMERRKKAGGGKIKTQMRFSKRSFWTLKKTQGGKKAQKEYPFTES